MEAVSEVVAVVVQRVPLQGDWAACLLAECLNLNQRETEAKQEQEVQVLWLHCFIQEKVLCLEMIHRCQKD